MASSTRKTPLAPGLFQGAGQVGQRLLQQGVQQLRLLRQRRGWHLLGRQPPFQGLAQGLRQVHPPHGDIPKFLVGRLGTVGQLLLQRLPDLLLPRVERPGSHQQDQYPCDDGGAEEHQQPEQAHAHGNAVPSRVAERPEVESSRFQQSTAGHTALPLSHVCLTRPSGRLPAAPPRPAGKPPPLPAPPSSRDRYSCRASDAAVWSFSA